MRISVRRSIAILLISIISVSVFSANACAHKPVFEDKDVSGYDDAIMVPDPDISYAFYGFLDSSDDIDYYYFDISGPFNVYTGLNVPKVDVYDDFRPAYAIIGPGINSSGDNITFAIPENMGAVVMDDNSQGEREVFYEPFSGITYYQTPMTYTELTVPGRYYIAVYGESHKMGDYVLAVGKKESFGLFELPGVFWAVIKLRLGWYDHSRSIAVNI